MWWGSLSMRASLIAAWRGWRHSCCRSARGFRRGSLSFLGGRRSHDEAEHACTAWPVAKSALRVSVAGAWVSGACDPSGHSVSGAELAADVDCRINAALGSHLVHPCACRPDCALDAPASAGAAARQLSLPAMPIRAGRAAGAAAVSGVRRGVQQRVAGVVLEREGGAAAAGLGSAPVVGHVVPRAGRRFWVGQDAVGQRGGLRGAGGGVISRRRQRWAVPTLRVLGMSLSLVVAALRVTIMVARSLARTLHHLSIVGVLGDVHGCGRSARDGF